MAILKVITNGYQNTAVGHHCWVWRQTWALVLVRPLSAFGCEADAVSTPTGFKLKMRLAMHQWKATEFRVVFTYGAIG